MSDELTRMDVLMSMPEMDRLQALGDEMYYGTFHAEETADGWRRLDPIDKVEYSDRSTSEQPPAVRFLGGHGDE